MTIEWDYVVIFGDEWGSICGLVAVNEGMLYGATGGKVLGQTAEVCGSGHSNILLWCSQTHSEGKCVGN